MESAFPFFYECILCWKTRLVLYSTSAKTDISVFVFYFAFVIFFFIKSGWCDRPVRDSPRAKQQRRRQKLSSLFPPVGGHCYVTTPTIKQGNKSLRFLLRCITSSSSLLFFFFSPPRVPCWWLQLVHFFCCCLFFQLMLYVPLLSILIVYCFIILFLFFNWCH